MKMKINIACILYNGHALKRIFEMLLTFSWPRSVRWRLRLKKPPLLQVDAVNLTLSRCCLYLIQVYDSCCWGSWSDLSIWLWISATTCQLRQVLLIVIAPIKIKVDGYFTLSTCENNDSDVFWVVNWITFVVASCTRRFCKLDHTCKYCHSPANFVATSQCSYNLLAIF